jgi:catalase
MWPDVYVVNPTLTYRKSKMKMIRRATQGTLPLVLFLICNTAGAQVPTPQPALKSTPTDMVNTLNSVFGDHHARAIHAKGIVLEGTFTPDPAAKSVTKAIHLQNKTLPVVVRFSNFAGIPDIPDNHPLASPRGIAIKFKMAENRSTDIVAHSFNGFPTADTDQFRELLQALAASGPDAAKPTKLDTYLDSHPIAKNFLTSSKPAPVSYGTLPYYGVNTFRFVNADGKITYGRYRIVPVATAAYLTDEQTAKAAPGYLGDEIRQHVQREPIKFKLLLQIAEKGDKIEDPSIAWPESRRTVALGTLAITSIAADDDAKQKSLVFMPNNLVDGIEVEDQMVNARAGAYAVSFGRRQ